MKGSDIGLTIMIFIVFISLQLFNILAIGIKNMKDNWAIYRCNPMILPFAGMFGHNGLDNFTYCIQNMNMNFMPYLMDPLNYIVNNITTTGEQYSSALTGFVSMGSGMSSGVQGMAEDGLAVLVNIFIVFQTMIIKLRDTFSKIVAVIVVLTYILAGVELTAISVWNGPVGGLTRWLAGIF
jgi:hypothetical protein